MMKVESREGGGNRKVHQEKIRCQAMCVIKYLYVCVSSRIVCHQVSVCVCHQVCVYVCDRQGYKDK